jgi:hypothetical protein
MKRMSSTCKKNRLALAVALCMAAPLTQASDINFSGFLSVGGGFVDDEKSPAYKGYDEEDLTFDKNLLGLQVTGQVNEKLSATAQLIARSENDYQVNAEWAYLTWQASDSIKVRAGRLRTPFYMYSDFIDVGYAYAWISPPSEVYYLPFNNVDGVDFYATSTLGIFDTSIQAYFGSFDDEFTLTGTPTTASTRNQMGLAGTLGKDWWTLRAAYHQAELSVDLRPIAVTPTTTIGSLATALPALGYANNVQRLLVEDDDATFAELGITIDTGRFVAAAEYVEFDPGASALSKNIRQFVMAGVREGSWLFHITGSQAKDEAGSPATGIAPNQAIPVFGSTNVLIGTLNAIAASQVSEREVVSLGARWDVASSTALKFQLDDVDNKTAGDQKVFSVALQAVF